MIHQYLEFLLKKKILYVNTCLDSTSTFIYVKFPKSRISEMIAKKETTTNQFHDHTWEYGESQLRICPCEFLRQLIIWDRIKMWQRRQLAEHSICSLNLQFVSIAKHLRFQDLWGCNAINLRWYGSSTFQL